MSTKLNVIFSDLYCGGSTGLLPPGFVTLEGNEIHQNPIQRFLWDAWRRAEDFVGEVVNGDPYALTVNGDITEGTHHGTKQVISPDAQDHLRCAEKALKPLADQAEAVFLVKGTECHVGNQEISLGSMLAAEANPDSNQKDPQRAFDRLTLEMGGVVCAFSHHIGTSIRDYLEATQLSVALNQELVSARRNGEADPRVVVRSHRHRFGFFGNGHSLCFVTAPWQGLTRFGHKVVTAARCHPGVLILDWRGKKDGELPAFHYRLYEAPSHTIVRID